MTKALPLPYFHPTLSVTSRIKQMARRVPVSSKPMVNVWMNKTTTA